LLSALLPQALSGHLFLVFIGDEVLIFICMFFSEFIRRLLGLVQPFIQGLFFRILHNKIF